MSKMKDKAIDDMNNDPDLAYRTTTRSCDLPNTDLTTLSFGHLFKLRDNVGLCFAILGHGDMTLSQLASSIQKELERRNA